MDDTKGLSVDPLTCVAEYDARSVTLTPREARLLTLLVESQDRVVTRDEIIEKLWNGRSCGPRVVDVNVYRLRARLKHIGHPGIRTVFRRGYRLAA